VIGNHLTAAINRGILVMNAGFPLRPATNEDRAAICRVVSSVLREFGFIEDAAATDADLGNIQASYLCAGGSFDVLLGQTGEVVGTVGLFPLGGGRCELRKLYLTAECRGRGLGKRLLQQALARARQLGFRRVELETASSLVVAARLYEAFGFRPFAPDHMSARCDKAYYLEFVDAAAGEQGVANPASEQEASHGYVSIE
jgi:putative acetyltransferase